MNEQRRQWNENQRLLQAALRGKDTKEEALALFNTQHAAVHDLNDPTTLAGQTLIDLREVAWRSIPAGHEHSPAWLLWHTARCEDITLNLLVASQPQVLLSGDWLHKMNISARDTGNAMDPDAIHALGQQINLEALYAYWTAVSHQTRQIVANLSPADWKRKPNATQIQQIIDQEAVLPPAYGLIDYWSSRTVAGLLLMPATRHPLVHLNEIEKMKLKKKIR